MPGRANIGVVGARTEAKADPQFSSEDARNRGLPKTGLDSLGLALREFMSADERIRGGSQALTAPERSPASTSNARPAHAPGDHTRLSRP
jgi:hypothetical protein